MACGPLPPNPAELLAGPKMSSLLAVASERFDIVIVDGPPVMGIADAPLLASIAHGTLLVVEAGQTRRGVTRAALKRLHFARAQMVGALLQQVQRPRCRPYLWLWLRLRLRRHGLLRLRIAERAAARRANNRPGRTEEERAAGRRVTPMLEGRLALDFALELTRMPTLATAMRAQPLPPDTLVVIRIAAGCSETTARSRRG